jgi:hypothetical protein
VSSEAGQYAPGRFPPRPHGVQWAILRRDGDINRVIFEFDLWGPPQCEIAHRDSFSGEERHTYALVVDCDGTISDFVALRHSEDMWEEAYGSPGRPLTAHDAAQALIPALCDTYPASPTEDYTYIQRIAEYLRSTAQEDRLRALAWRAWRARRHASALLEEAEKAEAELASAGLPRFDAKAEAVLH